MGPSEVLAVGGLGGLDGAAEWVDGTNNSCEQSSRRDAPPDGASARGARRTAAVTPQYVAITSFEQVLVPASHTL
jgi:hypothetical protein